MEYTQFSSMSWKIAATEYGGGPIPNASTSVANLYSTQLQQAELSSGIPHFRLVFRLTF